ncbi:MAG: histidine kinase [Rhodocyclales bacterium]|nr:histidine kinase [Rhodocyclales bacterium]
MSNANPQTAPASCTCQPPLKPLRMLFVDPSASDVAKLLGIFIASGYQPSHQQVATLEGLERALEHARWDVLLCDPILPGLDANTVLQQVRNQQLDLPVIMVSAGLRGEEAIAAMRAGAHDSLSKNSLDRLVPAVERELREAANRHEKRLAEQTLKTNEERLRALTDNIPGVVFRMGYLPGGGLGFQYLSEAAWMLFGSTADALIKSPQGWLHWLVKEDKPSFLEAVANSAMHRTTLNWEGRIRLITNEHKWINLRSSPRNTEDGRQMIWEGVMWNITHSKRAELDLRESRAQLAALSNHLQNIKEEERERIARDVHDVLGGTLVAMRFENAMLGGRITSDPARARKHSDSLEVLINDAIATVGRVTRELRPGILKDFGLAAAIESHGQDFTQRTGIPCEILCVDDEPSPEYATALALFRVFQEALTNVSKHAQAKTIQVRLMQEEDWLVLEIADDGKGFAAEDLRKPRSFGLRGMRERLGSLGGTMEVSPALPHGTRLTLRVPLKPEVSDDPINPAAWSATL